MPRKTGNIHIHIFLYVCAKVFSHKSNLTSVPIIVSRVISGHFVDVQVRCLYIICMHLFSSSKHNVANKLEQIVIFSLIVKIEFFEELAVVILLEKKLKQSVRK